MYVNCGIVSKSVQITQMYASVSITEFYSDLLIIHSIRCTLFLMMEDRQRYGETLKCNIFIIERPFIIM